MGQSHVKRRKRERPLYLFEQMARTEIQLLAHGRGYELNVILERQFAAWALSLARPERWPGEAPVPAGRHDLRRLFFDACLDGAITDYNDVRRFAREHGAHPNDDTRSSRNWAAPTSQEVAEASASQQRRVDRAK